MKKHIASALQILFLVLLPITFSNVSYGLNCSSILNRNITYSKAAFDITAEQVTRSALAVYDKIGQDKATQYFGWWTGRGGLEKNLKEITWTSRKLKNSWKRPQVLFKYKGDLMMSIVLYKGHVFAGNYFASRSSDLTENSADGRAINYQKSTTGSRAIELLPNGKFKIVHKASLRLARLISASTGAVKIYRGMSEFQFSMQLFTRDRLSESSDEGISALDVTQLEAVVEGWKNDPKYNHEINASDGQFAIWDKVMGAIKRGANYLTRADVKKMINDAFMSESADFSDKIVTHNMGIFTTPQLDIAYKWAFDRDSKYTSGVVAKYNLDINTIPESLFKDIYFGIEGDAIEVGFFNDEAKSFLLQNLEETPLTREGDPRRNPLWRRMEDQWDVNFDYIRQHNIRTRAQYGSP